MDWVRQHQILPEAPADATPGIRARTAMDNLRYLRDRLGQLAAPILGLDWQQMATAEAQGQRQAIVPIDPSMAERAGKAPFAQYAEEYPKVPRPAWKTEGEKRYLGRGENQETRAFNKALLETDKRMAQEGYTPMFDPAKRYNVDPAEAHYSKPPDYRRPAKPETAAKWRQLVQTPEAQQRLQAAFDHGLKTGGHEGWYKVGQLYNSFIQELGPEQGRAAFKEWAEAMGATTAGATPTENLRRAQFARFMKQRGAKIPEASAQLPVPLRGLELGGEMRMFNRAVGAGEGLTADQPKRMSFLADFLGFTDLPTIDKQMTQIITPGKAAPEGDSYFAYAELVRDMAAKNNMPVDEFQAIVWGGAKAMKGPYAGKSMMEIVNEAIERTSRMTGLNPQDVLRRGIIRAQIPVYGLIGAVGAGAAAGAARGGQQQ
jgi:hypothetical protein